MRELLHSLCGCPTCHNHTTWKPFNYDSYVHSMSWCVKGEGEGSTHICMRQGSYSGAICATSILFYNKYLTLEFSSSSSTVWIFHAKISCFQNIPHFTMKQGNYGSTMCSNLLEASYSTMILILMHCKVYIFYNLVDCSKYALHILSRPTTDLGTNIC